LKYLLIIIIAFANMSLHALDKLMAILILITMKDLRNMSS